MEARIERALAEARGQSDLFGVCRDFLQEILSSFRTLAVFSYSGEWVLVKLRGAEPQDLTLIDWVGRKRHSHLVLDTGRDPIFGQPPGYASALAVPIIGRSGQLLGLLYADHRQAAAFNQAQLKAAEGLAEKAADQLERLAPEVTQASTEGEPGQPWPVILLAVAAGLVMMAFLLSLPRLPSQPASAGPVVGISSSHRVAQAYLEHLRAQRWSEAYALLARSVQAELSAAEYRERLTHWTAQPRNRSQLSARQTTPGAEDEHYATVTLAPPPPGEGQTWQWHLTWQEDSWRIYSCQGGPSLNPNQ
ncbi:MAG: GAF domain-containing protein [Vulcanimicrobiota bacterium]